MMLKSLVQHNAERSATYEMLSNRPNGIACPHCGGEMVDDQPHVTLTTDPPQTQITCPSCNYETLRVV